MKKYFFAVIIICSISCNTKTEPRKNFYSRESMAFIGGVKECCTRTYDSFKRTNNIPEAVVPSISDSTIWHFNKEGYITHIDQYIFNQGIVDKHNSIRYSFSNNIPVKLEFYTNDTLQKITDIKFLGDTVVQEDINLLSTGQRLKSTITIARNNGIITETNNTILKFGADEVNMTTTTKNSYEDGILVNSVVTGHTIHDGKPFSDGGFDYKNEYIYTILKKDRTGNPLSGLVDLISDYGRQKHTILQESSYTYWVE